jgi:hypothetical protein
VAITDAENDQESIQLEITKLRSQLHLKAKSVQFNFQDSEVLELSNRLDELVVMAMTFKTEKI